MTGSDNMFTECFKETKNASAEVPPRTPEDSQNQQVGLPGPAKSPTWLQHVCPMLRGSKKDSAEISPGTPQGLPESPSWLLGAFPWRSTYARAHEHVEDLHMERILLLLKGLSKDEK